MKKILSVLVFTLFCVVGVFAQSYIKFNVQLADDSEGMGYVTVSSSNTVSNDYTTTSAQYSSESTNCSYFFVHLGHGQRPSQGYAFARTSDDNRYHFVGWSKTNNVEDIISEEYLYGPIGDISKDLFHCKKITDDNGTFYAHFAENEGWDFIFNPVREGGQYTVDSKSGAGSSTTITTTSDPLQILGVTNVNDAIFTLTHKADDANGFRFARWRFEYSDGKVDYDYSINTSIEKSFTKSATISCEFISKDYAQFCLKGGNNSYFRLSDAIIAAQAPSAVSKVIVVKESGVLYKETESTDYYNLAENTYTIPAGITLLIPGNDARTIINGPISKNEFSEGSFKNYRCLTIPSNITLEFNGNLCVYATLNPNMSCMSSPMSYGQIHLCNGAKIQLNKDAIANVYGYITGNINDETEVRVKSGATIYEVMQVRDWRGGTGTSKMLSNKYQVFPINNYYVQNVETNLVLEAGAYEYASTGIAISNPLTDKTETVFTDIPFIVPKDGKETSGLVRLANATYLTKSYDRSNDKLVLEVTSTDTSQETELGEVVINLSGYKMISSDYVFPISPNIVLKFTDASAYTKYPITMLAGAKLVINKNSTITANGNIFIYDADQNKVSGTGHEKFPTTNSYGYFGSSNQDSYFVYKTPSYPSPYTAPAIGKRTVQDAVVDINGVLRGPIYTTSSGAQIISTEGTGKVEFSGLVGSTKTYQALQYGEKNFLGMTDQKFEYPSITITAAQLLNADNSYSAGGDASTENGRTYTYYPLWNNGDGKPKGRWSHELNPGTIQPNNIKNETKIVYVPEKNSWDVSFVPNSTGTVIDRIKEVTFTSDKFSSNDAKYDKESGSVTISVQYDATADHGLIVEPTMTVVFECKNTISGISEDINVNIPLHVEQDYTPKFTVNQSEDESIEINFNTITIGQSGEALITVEPLEENVTDRKKNEGKGYVTWNPQTLSAQSPFRIETGNYFDGVNVYYEPTTINNQPHEETLEITATYPGVTPVKKTIILKGTPQLAQNTNFSFVEDVTIFPSESINPLFVNMGNGSMDITFTFGEDDESENEYVEVKKNADENNWILKVRDGVNIITKQTIKIKAIQSETDKASSGTDEMIVKIQPLVQWNWSKLYFNTTRDNPVEVANGEEYTLEYTSGCDGLLDYNADTKTIEVNSGEECTAYFLFKQNDYSVTFTSEVYADPRVLDMCMSGANAIRTYRDITKDSTNVRYEDGIVFATTESAGAAWTMEIIGVPDRMAFIPYGEGKRWTIMEFDGESWETTYASDEIILTGEQTHFVHNLKASTQQIRINCSLGATQGKITDLCVYALNASVKANVEKLYVPIVKDENGTITQSQKNVVLSYVSPSSDLSLSVVNEAGNIVSDITLTGDNLTDGKLPKTTATNPYSEEIVTVSSMHTTEGIVYLLVKDNADSEMLKLPIRLYNYPQPLPMRSAEWKDENAEKYYFYTDLKNSQNVQFNAATQKLTFASAGIEQRFVTFAFRGGPSYIHFESSLDFVPQENVTVEELVLQEWYDYWTLEVTDGETHRLVANSVEAQVKPEITAEVKDGKTYYQIRIAIPYTTKSLTLQNKRGLPIEVQNVVIDGEPDLDVVLGNHTIEHEGEANFSTEIKSRTVEVTAINLPSLKVSCNNSNFVVKYGGVAISSTPTELTADDCPKALGIYQVGNIGFDITWDRTDFDAVDEGLLIFTDKDGQQLATIRLLGTEDYILAGNASSTGL